MFIPTLLFLLSTLPLTPALTALNCYHAKHPIASSCAASNLWAMRDQLCSSTANWGEGFRFLSGHGVVLRQQDNCIADNNPNGIDLTMTISSTVKDRDDCWNRTRVIIDKCVVEGAPVLNGGEWWDLEGEEERFIWLQWLHVEPPVVYNGTPPYYEEEVAGKKRGLSKRMERRRMMGPDRM